MIYSSLVLKGLFDDGARVAGEGGGEVGDVGNNAGAAVFGEFENCFNFWQHGAGSKIAVAFKTGKFGSSDTLDSFLFGSVIIDKNVWYAGD